MVTRLATVHRGRDARTGDDAQDPLRLWLRLHSCTTMIERAICRRLRQRFATSLARFDLLAQLERAPSGLRMSELSRRLMVTGGNVTGLVAQLVKEGLVERAVESRDRRVCVVSMTGLGRESFRRMAAEHEGWVVELTEGIVGAERARLHELLGSLKTSVRAREPEGATEAIARLVRPEPAPVATRA